MLLLAAAVVSSLVLRPVYDEPAAGRVAAKYGATQTKYYVPSEKVIDASDLARDPTIYGPNPLDGTWEVKVYVAPDGAKRLNAWTREHIYRDVGIFVDGKLVSVASVKAPLSDVIMIWGNFSKQRASHLARQIRRSPARSETPPSPPTHP